MNTHRRAIALIFAVLLAGCGGLRLPGGPVEPWVRADGLRPRSDAESLLMYFEYLRRLPPVELAKEHETAQQLFARSRSDFVRVRYAMAAGAPGAGGNGNDEARALEALAPLLKNPDAALHGIAFMVNAQIQEQRRAQGFNEKLDALKQLEKQMIERDPATATKRR